MSYYTSSRLHLNYRLPLSIRNIYLRDHQLCSFASGLGRSCEGNAVKPTILADLLNVVK